VIVATARIDVSVVAPPGVQWCAVSVYAPDRPVAGAPVPVAVCLPGGYYRKEYFDLVVPPGTGEYSMARHLAARGWVVVTCDPPGIGGSDGPDDGYDLTPAALADTQAAVTATVLADLRAGTFVAGLPPVPHAAPIGVGHSAGALLTVHEQARHRPFVALALLGFAGHGLVEHLTDEERALADDPAAAAAALPRLVAQRFGGALPALSGGTTSRFSDATAPAEAKTAMRAAQDRLLALLGLTSMIPGASAPELAAIDVPVFLGVGDADITGDPHVIPSHVPGSSDVTLFVLPHSGHAHHLAPTRTLLWDRLDAWARALPPA
jgi:alpha-beta hydrolase superfamily lysophospholipase